MAPIATFDQLEAIRRLMSLLQDVGYTAVLLMRSRCWNVASIKCSKRANTVCEVVPLVGDHDIKDQVIDPIGNISGADYTVSSQYTSFVSLVARFMTRGNAEWRNFTT